MKDNALSHKSGRHNGEMIIVNWIENKGLRKLMDQKQYANHMQMYVL